MPAQTVTSTPPAPTVSPRARRYDARREELIDAATRTVFQRGLARTSLREIANHSAFSHGVLHYYFTDKDELVREVLDRYCASVLVQFDGAIVADQSLDEFVDRLTAVCTTALGEGREAQRLWYDVSTESMYEPDMREQLTSMTTALRTAFDRVLGEFERITGRTRQVSATLTAALWNGLWEDWLHRSFADDMPSMGEQADTIRTFLRVVTA